MTEHNGERYKISQRLKKKFGQEAQETWYVVNFNEDVHHVHVQDVVDDIHSLFDSILNRLRAEGVRNHDLVRVHVAHPDVITKGDVTVSIRPFAEMNSTAITNAIQNFLQSNDTLKIDQDFEIATGVIRIPNGGAHKPIQKTRGHNNCITSKRSIVEIKNTDNLCMARALVVCRAHHMYKEEKIAKTRYNYLCDSRRPAQEKEASELQKMAKISLSTPCSLRDISCFENVLNAQIIVLSETRHFGIIYVGAVEREKKYFLLHIENEGNYTIILLLYYINDVPT